MNLCEIIKYYSNKKEIIISYMEKVSNSLSPDTWNKIISYIPHEIKVSSHAAVVGITDGDSVTININKAKPVSSIKMLFEYAKAYKKYDSFVETYGENFIPIMFGYKPHINYDRNYYYEIAELCRSSDTVTNVHAAAQYIHMCHGNYLRYDMTCGQILTKPDGTIMLANITINSGNKLYHIFLNRLYDNNQLEVNENPMGGMYKLFTTKGYNVYAPLKYTCLSYDKVCKILSTEHYYGPVVTKVLSECLDMIKEDHINYADKPYNQIMHV